MKLQLAQLFLAPRHRPKHALTHMQTTTQHQPPPVSERKARCSHEALVALKTAVGLILADLFNTGFQSNIKIVSQVDNKF